MYKKILSLVVSLIMLAIMIPSQSALAASVSATVTFNGTDPTATSITATFGNGSKTPGIKQCSGYNGWVLDSSDKNASYINCNIEDSVMKDISSTKKILVRVRYFDALYDGAQSGGFAILYDAQNGKKGSQYVNLENTCSWQWAEFYLDDACFNNSLNGNDFIILSNDRAVTKENQRVMGISGSDVVIRIIEVSEADALAPFEITVNTEKPGNIFFEGDSVDFGIDFTDKTGTYKSGNVTYTVRNADGNKIIQKNDTFSNNFGAFSVDSIDFGTYTLEISVNNGSINQTKVVDFAYSKKAENPNAHFGTNVHFDWAVYDLDDVKAMADLAKNAGYKFLRSSIRWNLIETEKGVYSLPANIEYSNKYADEIGLEILGILTGDTAYEINGEKVGCGGINRVDTEEEIEAYKNFCYWTVKELKDYTDYWSYINEYNLVPGGGHVDSTKTSYVALAKAAYPVIRAANPHSVIVGGEVGSYWTDRRDWISYCYNNNILNACDVFTLHTYDQVGGPESWHIYGSIKDFHDTLKNTNSTKKAWITENGWPSNDLKNNGMISGKSQAQYYSRSMGINADTSRIDKHIYYSFVDNNTGYFNIEDNYGILHSHDWRTPFAAKPAYVAVAAYSSILDGYKYYGDLDGTHESLMENGWEYDDYGSSPVSYTDAKFRKVFKNADGDEIVMAWKASGCSATAFNYASDKKYFEIYDMYGNKTLLENTTGKYSGTYSQNPIYIHATDVPLNGDVCVNNVTSAWRLGDGNMNVTVTLPEKTPSGSAVKIIAAAYSKDGSLLSTQIKSRVYKSREINVSFPTESIKSCKTVKIFALDSLDNLTPLTENEVVCEFGDSAEIKYSKSGDLITLNGTLPEENPYTNLLVTVMSGDTAKSDLSDEEKFENAVLYQDMTVTDSDGKYKITFKLPSSYTGDTIKVHLSSKGTVLQKIISVK